MFFSGKRRSEDTFLYFIANSKRYILIFFFLGIYFFIGVLFGLLYDIFNLSNFESIRDNIYFSFLVQTGLGYSCNYFTNFSGQFLSVIQYFFGTVWLIFIPSMMIIRLMTPKKSTFIFGKYVIFYPVSKSFRFRYANFSKLDASDVKIDLRAREIIDEDEFNVRNIKVKLNNPNIPDARSMVPYFIRTKILTDNQCEVINPDEDYEMKLHPGHLDEIEEFQLRLSCSFSTGLYNKFETFYIDKVFCGKFVAIQPHQEIPPNWEKLNKYELTNHSENGKQYCLNQCEFRTNCKIQNREFKNN